MAPVSIRCPHCQVKSQLQDGRSVAGKRLRCPKCGKVIVVKPSATAAKEAKEAAGSQAAGGDAEFDDEFEPAEFNPPAKRNLPPRLPSRMATVKDTARTGTSRSGTKRVGSKADGTRSVPATYYALVGGGGVLALAVIIGLISSFGKTSAEQSPSENRNLAEASVPVPPVGSKTSNTKPQRPAFAEQASSLALPPRKDAAERQGTSEDASATSGDVTQASFVPPPSNEAAAGDKDPAAESEVAFAPPARNRPATQPTPRGSGRSSRPSGSNSEGWTQYRGPNRENISPDRGLLTTWPGDGPPLAWTARGLGEGFSSVALAGDRLFTMGNLGGDEMVLALDLANGKIIWSQRNGSAYNDRRGSGPRGTPTIDGNVLYALGGNGDLSCFDTSSGDVRWQKNILREFGGHNINWGISESVLIDGDRLICTPGGSNATMAALDKQSGKVIWRASVPGQPQAGYSSPIIAEVGGVKQYINFTSTGVVGVRAADGQFLWQDRKSANGTANCSTPVFADNHVFSASGYGTGGALVKLTSSGNKTNASLVYHTKDMKNHHGGMVVVDGHLYGSNDPGILMCLELKSGRVAWQDRSVGKGAVTYADGHIYLRGESGQVALVEATPAGYREKGRFRQPNRSNYAAWPHPVVAGGRLFLRDMDVLLCYDVTGR